MADSKIVASIWVAKMVLFSIGIISTFFFLKVAIIPCVFSFFTSLPRLWILFKNLLSPPYIYFVLNFIILTIIIASSSSAFHSQTHFPRKKSLNTPGNSTNLSDIVFTMDQNEKYEENDVDVDVPLLESDSDDSCVTDSGENNRKEKGTEVEGPEMSIDETWRMIMEGQGKGKPKPVMKKCETWERRRNVAVAGDVAVVRRRERSINGEELKERSEAFIKRFTREMRIQKQESDQRFIEMVSRGN